MDADAVFPRAIEPGVSFTPGSLFSATRKYRNFMRLSCGAPFSDAVDSGLRTLATLAWEQV